MKFQLTFLPSRITRRLWGAGSRLSIPDDPRESRARHFFGFPSPTDINDYESSREFLATAAAARDDILGLYEYGTVAAPGLSDMDLIAIVRESNQDPNLAGFLRGDRAPDYVLRVLDGRSIKPMTSAHFERVQILGPIETRPLYEVSQMKPLSLTERERYFADVANVMDWLPERILTIRGYLERSDVAVRPTVGGIVSFRHSVDAMVRVAGEDTAGVIEFSEALDNLRSGWFSRSDSSNADTIDHLLSWAVRLGRELVHQFGLIIDRRGHYSPPELAGVAYFWIDRARALRVDDVGTQAQSNLGPVSSPMIEDVPAVWLSHALECARVGGYVGRLINGNISPQAFSYPEEVAPEMSVIINRRITLCNDIAEFLAPLELLPMMYRFAHLKPISAES